LVSRYDLPGRDGVALLEAVRDTDPDLPFVLFTDAGDEGVASRAISAGVTEYVQKESPFRTAPIESPAAKRRSGARPFDRPVSSVETVVVNSDDGDTSVCPTVPVSTPTGLTR
jgi:DNA-binding NarL/FixJ family response regulator